MKNKGLVMSNKYKTCIDCLHCKVSKKSKGNWWLCFCSKISKKAIINEVYWLNKPVCKEFYDMSA